MHQSVGSEGKRSLCEKAWARSGGLLSGSQKAWTLFERPPMDRSCGRSRQEAPRPRPRHAQTLIQAPAIGSTRPKSPPAPLPSTLLQSQRPARIPHAPGARFEALAPKACKTRILHRYVIDSQGAVRWHGACTAITLCTGRVRRGEYGSAYAAGPRVSRAKTFSRRPI
jgi:hypothetical protein